MLDDIVELCDREADLLNRGRSASSVDGLRKRISNLFLQFIETPDFNPESTRFLKVRPLAARHGNAPLTAPAHAQVPNLQLQNATIISK